MNPVRRGSLIVVGSVLALVAGVVPASAVTIDDFTTDQGQLMAPPASASTVGGAGIIGTNRDLELTALSGPGTVTVEVTGGQLQLVVPDTSPDTRGRALATWDGDTDPGTLDPAGLGGLDLTAGNRTGFRLTVDAAGAGAEVVIEVHTDGANASQTALVLPSVTTSTAFDLSFSSFVATLGAGADFTSVGAISMSVTGLEVDVDLDMLETVGPAIVLGGATKEAILVVDNDGDGRVDPGDVLRYTINVTNTGAEATDVLLNDVIEPNLMPVGLSLFTAPVATPDTYLACGNTLLTVDDSPALPGLTGNDHDPDGENFTISTVFPIATDRGGAVDSVDPVSGAFDYVPPAGFTGVDGFSYEIEDDGGRTSTATVTVMVDGMVWFVDADAAPGGTGTQASPFNNLGDVETASGPGDTIFVFAGAADAGDGIALQDGQQLIGEGVGLTACGSQIVPPGSRPTIVNPTSTVIRVANGNRIAGLDIEPEGDEDALVGNLFTDLEVEQVGIDTSRVGPGNGGVRLTDPLGVINFDQLSVVGTGTGTAFAVTGGAPQLTVTNSSLTPSGGSLLRFIQVATGGVIDILASNTLSLTGGTGPAVQMSLNTAQISIAALGDLETTGTGGGIVVTDSAPVTIDSVGNVSATSGPALEISNSTVSAFGGGPVVIESLSSAGSLGHGVNLSSSVAELSVTAATLVNSPASHGIYVNGGSGASTFGAVAINGAGGSGVVMDGHAGTLAISAGTIGDLTPTTGNAIDINGGGGDVMIAAHVTGHPLARSVEITNRAGGTVDLSGIITDPGLGVRLNTNGPGTIAFSGSLDLDTTTKTAFDAAGGGTVTVTGSPNTIDTTTGIGVNISHTDIGAAGITFESVSVTGASSGIVLDDTGILGFFEVAGDGPSDPTDTTRGRTTVGAGGGITLGSGGTLANTTGDSVILVDADNVTLRNMVLSNNNAGSRDGVHASTGSDGLVLDNVRITGFSDNGLLVGTLDGVTLQHCEVEGNAKSGDSVVNDEANVQLENVFGTVLVANSLIRDATQDNIQVSSCEFADCGGTTLDLTLDNVAVMDTAVGAGGNDGVLVRSFNDADVDLTVRDSLFERNRGSAIHHTSNNEDTTGSTTVINSTINRSTHAINVAHQGETHSFNIDNNEINTVDGTPDNFGNAVNIFLAEGSLAASQLVGHITDNTIGNASAIDSASTAGNGIDLYASGAGTLTAHVDDNTIRAVSAGAACRAASSNHTGAINLTVTNNDFDVNPSTAFPLSGLELLAGAQTGDTGTICADLRANTAFIGGSFDSGIFVWIPVAPAVIELEGYSGADNDFAALTAFFNGTATTVNPAPLPWVGSGTIRAAAADCPMPPAP